MKFLFDLSFRYKIPLWGSMLIMVPAFAVSALFIAGTYADFKHDAIMTSQSLARTLSGPLFGAMLHDDVWRAFQILRSPLLVSDQQDRIAVESLTVLNEKKQVYVSTAPNLIPMLVDYASLGNDYRALTLRLDEANERASLVIDLPESERIYVMTPISEDGVRLGTLVLVHTKDAFRPRLYAIAQRAFIATALILAILLPVNWYWGQRTAVPLMQLADRIGQVAHRVPEELPPGIYNYRDELGQLSDAFSVMVGELRHKAVLEREVIQSERLAAIGKLSAGIAHEINNPLAGMLVALDNFKHRAGTDEKLLRTASMLERGLMQIKETVGAMLVEAKLNSRDLAPQDIEDTNTLVAGEARKKSVRVVFESTLAERVTLPATLVRQILINLLLNAIQASDSGGEVGCAIARDGNTLRIEIANGGKPLPPERMEHLFEPFASRSESGHGLGLWVTYQITAQLGGHIQVARANGLTRFIVTIPAGVTA
jgi:signal transduction histidine kinase